VIQLPGQIDLGQVRTVPATTPKAPRASAPKVSAPKATAAPASGSTTIYVVKPGDSLSVIAHRHGVKTADLRAANGIKGDKILVGQKLKIVGATKTPAGTTSAKAAAPKAAAPKMAAPKATASTPKTETKPQATVATPPPAPAATAETVAPAPVESAPVKVETTAAPATVSPVAADPNVQTYTVKEGEDLYAVAIRWGVSPSDLKSLNNLTGSELKAGSVLKIPGGVR
jgi:LysM repeat protein